MQAFIHAVLIADPSKRAMGRNYAKPSKQRRRKGILNAACDRQQVRADPLIFTKMPATLTCSCRYNPAGNFNSMSKQRILFNVFSFDVGKSTVPAGKGCELNLPHVKILLVSPHMLHFLRSF